MIQTSAMEALSPEERFLPGRSDEYAHASFVVALVLMAGLDFVWLGRMGDARYWPVTGDMSLPGYPRGHDLR